MRLTRSSLRPAKSAASASPALRMRWSMSATRPMMSSALRPLAAASRAVTSVAMALMRSTAEAPARSIAWVTSSAEAPIVAATSPLTPETRSPRRMAIASRSLAMPRCASSITARTRPPLARIASRWSAISAISERMRRSLSEYARSSVVTSERTSVSSSAARASARSMPSPIVPISRRIACASEATFSLATVSGSASRSAT